jgi:hypothetical protein
MPANLGDLGVPGIFLKLSKMLNVVKAHSAESMVTRNMLHASKAHGADSTPLCMIMAFMVRKFQRYAPCFTF